MKKKMIFLFIVALSLILSGCGNDEGSGASESNTTATQGWHFQGRDCLACHNVDLATEEHLLIGGTLYKNQSVQNQDDLNETCGGEIVVNFYDNPFATVPSYSSSDYKDVNSKGYKGKGNLFILQRKLGLISAGDYYIELATTNGDVLADRYLHKFSSQSYDINNPIDWTNRVSCNACHSSQKNAPAYPLYVKTSAVSLCK